MRRVAIGVDVGGTKTAAAVVDETGAVLHGAVVLTPARDGGPAVLEAACELARELVGWAEDAGDVERADVIGCGVGVAGVVNPDGVVTQATDSLPGWVGVDVAAGFRAATGLPVGVVNDVHALALGEARFGAATGAESALVVAVGTGVGGAYVRRGELLAGSTGTAGSIGHVPVRGTERRRCPCGALDHLEAYASGPSIVARYVERGGVAVRLEAVLEQAVAGDRRAADVVADAGMYLGEALAAALNLLDPQVVVIGGGAAHSGDLLLGPMRTAAAAHALPGPRSAPVVTAGGLRHGSVVGAASLWLGSSVGARDDDVAPSPGMV